MDISLQRNVSLLLLQRNVRCVHMQYTFVPEEKHAKSFGRNLEISTKNAQRICTIVRGKKLSVARRLLNDVAEGRRSLRGKYYTSTTKMMEKMLESCAANAKSLGLDEEKLFVHASAHHGTHFHRRRRKARFGSQLKRTHVEVMLIERGGKKKAEGRKG
ncbi:MAG: hypothetical protein HYW25_03350 [Candidatus Aenigmarchaeota archaeon]|nr:hypothetical protein [Candidatus Aenigmarchaeota archaeon]